MKSKINTMQNYVGGLKIIVINMKQRICTMAHVRLNFEGSSCCVFFFFFWLLLSFSHFFFYDFIV